MSVLGKDLFDLERPLTHTKIQFGEMGYWVESLPVCWPYGTVLTVLLNFKAEDYLNALSALRTAIASKDRLEIVKAFYETMAQFVKLPFYRMYILDYGSLEPALLETLLEGISELRLADRILEDDGTILNKYFWAGEDIPMIQERYTWFLDSMFKDAVFEKKKGQRKEPLASQITKTFLEPFVSGVSLGKSHEVDAPQVNVQYAVMQTKDHEPELVEKMYFDRISDFIYVEFMKGLQKGFVPKRCANCGRWFLQQPGNTYAYCRGPAPGQDGKTCREVGATSSFQNKVKNNDVWKLHQRAYKKYFARARKGTMSKTDFETWAREAETLRDKALEEYEQAASAEERNTIVTRLELRLNCR